MCMPICMHACMHTSIYGSLDCAESPKSAPTAFTSSNRVFSYSFSSPRGNTFHEEPRMSSFSGHDFGIFSLQSFASGRRLRAMLTG